MPNIQFDVVIVGSGPAGVHAAYPLIEAGLKVAIIDGGLDSKKKDKKLNDFSETKFSKKSNAYDLIKKSSHVFNNTYRLLQIKSKIEIIQSLAKGGLSEQWHGICDFFSEEELKKVGLPIKEIKKEYIEVSKLINLKLKTKLDFHSKLLLETSEKNINAKIKLYQASLAFPYRTSSVIDELKKFKNFTYIPNRLVYRVNDTKKYVEIKSFSIDKSIKLFTYTKFLILAAGSVNSTRILLRSLNLYNYKTTFLTKAHYLVACLYPKTLLSRNKIKKEPSTQLVISSQNTIQGVASYFIQLYKFNPLVINKALRYVPLPKFLAFPLLSFFASSLMIADIRFPAFETKRKFCKLVKDNLLGDVLEISFEESTDELYNHKNEYNKITEQLQVLGLFPLKTASDYTTSHYAGGIPYQQKQGKLSADLNGKLHQSNSIYMADSSTWRALPAKAPTLTIMANATRVGKKVLKNFQRKNDNIL